MAYGLLKRILQHVKEQGWLKPNDIILDPFGGIGSTGILGAYEGYRVVCVELEQKFCDLAEANFRLHDNAWQKLGCPRPVIIQGDSRQLCRILEKADCIVSSPPYAESLNSEKSGIDWSKLNEGGKKCTKARESYGNNFGTSPGQLGGMKPGRVDAVISSPSYGEAQTGGGIVRNGYHNEAMRKGVFDLVGKRSYTPENQGQADGNLANLKPGDISAIISSPPHGPEALGHRGSPSQTDKNKRLYSRISGNQYGQTDGNLGNLKPGEINSIINLDRQNNCAIILPCEHVKIVENQLGDGADGANHVLTSTSRKHSRTGRSPRSTDSTLPRLNGASQCQTIGDQNISSGQEAQNLGEDTLGEANEPKPLSEMDTNVAYVDGKNIYKSITRKAKTKRVERGTIALTISKRDAPNVTLTGIGTKKNGQSAQNAIADSNEANLGQQNVNVRIANENLQDRHKSDSTTKKPKHTPAKNVASNSNSLDTDINTVPLNASENPGQNTCEDSKPSTFWEAARDIVSQCFQILRPGGHAIFVVKDFVRNKRKVDFTGDWQRLCESVGFKTLCVHHAMLVNETEHKSLFGHKIKDRKERKSFFRRLAESKGSPRIDYETVLCMQKGQGE